MEHLPLPETPEGQAPAPGLCSWAVGSEEVMEQVLVAQGVAAEQQRLGPSDSPGDDTVSITRLPLTPCLI